MSSNVAGYSGAISALQANAVSQGNTISAQAASITALNSNVTSLTSNVNSYSTAIAGLQTNSVSQGANIASQAASITALNSNVAALNSANAAQSTAIAALQTNSVSQGANIATQAASITSLGSTLTANLSGYASLPTTFFGGFGNWTTSRAGTPTSVAASDTYGTIVQDDDFGYAFQSSTLIAAGNNLCTRGVVQAVAGRIYEIKCRMKVSAFSPAGQSFNLIVLGLDTSYTATLISLSTQTISSTGTVYEFVGRISDTSSAGVVSWGTAAFLRYGVRVNSSPTSMTYQIGEISCRDVTDTWALGLTTTAQSNAITALQTLTTAQGSNITTQAASITSLQSQINDSGADNLVYNPSFESGTATVSAEGWSVAGTYTSAVVQNLISYDGNQGKSQRINATGLTTTVYADLKTATGVEAQVTAGKSYSLSAYVNATNSIFQHRMYIQFRDSSGAVISTPNTALITSINGWQRLTLASTAPAGAVDAVIYLRTFGASTTASTAGTIYWDMVQLELGSVTGFRDNIRASTSAISGLTTSITALGSNVTATATSLTSLTASIGDTGGANLFYNPSFSGSGTTADGWTGAVVSGGTITSTLPASTRTIGGKMVQQVYTGLSASIYGNLYTSSATNFAPVVAGQAYTLSVWVKATAGLSIRPYIFWNDASSANLGNNGVTVVATGAWQQITLTAPAITGAFNARPQLRVYSGTVTGGTVQWDSVQLEQGIYATAWRDNPTASITSLQTVTASTQDDVTTLTARASLTVSTGGAITGFSISSNSAAGSVFAIQADKFVLTSGTKAVSPFTVDTVNNLVTATNLRVDTLQIMSGAVTNTELGTGTSVTISPNTWTEILRTASIITEGGQVLLNASAVLATGTLSSTAGSFDTTIKFRRSANGGSTWTDLVTYEGPYTSPLYSTSGLLTGHRLKQLICPNWIDSPSSGTYVYAIWVIYNNSSYGGTSLTPFISATEFKR